ncbi:MAG TPA: cytochrome c biogenesis protein CcdC [Bacillota bacterium]|nr:cytochrome c biogenesis protein CcdC [Bacillota bacterium]
MFLVAASTVVALLMAFSMFFVRLKASHKPTSAKKIILPPLFMSTGSLMYLVPIFRINLTQALEALCIGMLFAIFLIKTSKLTIRQRNIYLLPSKSFILILLGLLLLRTILKFALGGWGAIDPGASAGMFYLLALAMIVTWRVTMLHKYFRLKRQLKERNETQGE